MIFVTKKLDCSDDLNKAIEMCEFWVEKFMKSIHPALHFL